MSIRFLSGLRIVEMGESRAIGFAGKLLADLGAELWILEPPGRGHRFRHQRPKLPSGVGGVFEFLARGKKSFSVDTGSEDGHELVRRFLQRAHGVLADRAWWEKSGWQSEDFQQELPAAVVTVSSYGTPNPLQPESEFVDFHEGGGGYMTPGRVADPVQEYPLDLGHGGQASYIGGLYAAIALMHGLMIERPEGGPVWNDVSIQAALATTMVLNVPWFHYAGEVPSRLRSAGRPTRATGGMVRVRDGRIAITMIEEHQWDGLLRALGHPEWAEIPLFQTQLDRSRHWDALRLLLEEHLQDSAKDEVMARCQAENVPVFAVRGMADVLASEHEQERGFFSPSELDGILLPTTPWLVDGEPVRSKGRSPSVGEHTREALELMELTADDYETFRELGIVW